jgi:hypothetical protein
VFLITVADYYGDTMLEKLAMNALSATLPLPATVRSSDPNSFILHLPKTSPNSMRVILWQKDFEE